MKILVVLKKWWFWTGSIVLIIGGSLIVYSFTKDTGPEYVTETVQQGTFTQTVEVSGELESLKEVQMAFETSGTVAIQFVQVGDLVSSGDLLLTLESGELSATVEKARQSVRSAQAVLDQTLAGSTQEAIAVAKAAVTIAQANLANAQVTLETAQEDVLHTQETTAAAVSEAEISLQKAQDAYENVLATNTDTLEQIREDFLTVFESNMIAVRTALSDADEVLGIDNVTANDDYQNVLSNLDENALVLAQAWYKTAKVSRDYAEDLVFALESSASIEEIEVLFDPIQTALNDVTNTLLYTHRALDATSLTSASFTPAELESLKAQIDLARESIQTTQGLFLGQKQLSQTTQINNKTNEEAYFHAFNASQQTLETAQISESSKNSTAQASVEAAQVGVEVQEASLQKAQASLQEVSADPRDVDLERLSADVAAAQAELSATEVRLAKRSLVSPFSGVVTHLALEQGEQAVAGSPVVTVQTVEEQFQIIADIPESDITKISRNDQVVVTFDALGSDEIFSGAVEKIDPAEKNIEGVIFYEITVYLQEEERKILFKPGMSADLEIYTDEREGIITVPQRSILQKEGKKYVRVLEDDGSFIEQTVEVGKRGNQGRVEIMSGLQTGQVIVVTLKE